MSRKMASILAMGAMMGALADPIAPLDLDRWDGNGLDNNHSKMPLTREQQIKRNRNNAGKKARRMQRRLRRNK